MQALAGTPAAIPAAIIDAAAEAAAAGTREVVGTEELAIESAKARPLKVGKYWYDAYAAIHDPVFMTFIILEALHRYPKF